MNVHTLGCCLAGAVGAAALFVAVGAGSSADAAALAGDAQERRATSLAGEVAGLRERVDRLAAEARRPREAAPAFDPSPLEERIARLETAVASAATAAPSPSSAARERPAEDLAALGRRVAAGEATAEEAARYWEALRTSKELPRLIDELTREAAAHPDDLAVRLRLADACVARLYTVPDGPERGAWASRAEQQWGAVLERSPEHWRARYSLARSLAQWPEMFRKGPEAIRHLERLREQQETAAAEPHHAEVYLLLASLHRREGSPDRALAALDAGARRHPESEPLRTALAQARR